MRAILLVFVACVNVDNVTSVKHRDYHCSLNVICSEKTHIKNDSRSASCSSGSISFFPEGLSWAMALVGMES